MSQSWVNIRMGILRSSTNQQKEYVMIWKNLSIAKKLGAGFGVILILTTVISLVSTNGIGKVVHNANEVIDGNVMRGDIVTAEVAHLNWAKTISTFLSEHGENLDVQFDDHLCNFGKWLYGDERKRAEAMVPSLAPLLKEIEVHHHDLHASAAEIKKEYRHADHSLPDFLSEMEIAHLKFVSEVDQIFLTHGASFDVESDPNQCDLGKWLNGEGARQAIHFDPQLKSLINDLRKPHADLHGSVANIQKIWRQDDPAAVAQAKEIYLSQTIPALHYVEKAIEAIDHRALANLAGYDKANEIYTGHTLPSLENVQKILIKIRAEISKNMMTDAAMLENASQTRKKVIVIALISIAIGVVIAVLIAKAISKPLALGADFAGQIAEGDLTSTLKVEGKDEIGQLAGALNSMVANLRQMMQDIGENSSQVATASEELSATSQQMAAGAEEMTSQAGTVAAAAEEIGVNMNTVSTTASMMNGKSDDIASSALEMSGNVNSVAAAIEEMTASIGEVAENSSSASNLAGRANELSSTSSEEMKKLDQAAGDIGNVINLITEITEQTKLLSLNATIEAARAGEAGKGFAVVANEVKDLARQTSEATDEIVGRIQAMQSQTASVVDNINKMSKVNRQVNEINTTIAAAIEEQSATTNEIARTINETSAAVSVVTENIQELSTNIEQEILGSVNEAVTGAQDVSVNIQGVSTVSGDTAQGAGAINQASTELATLATQLQGQVARFTI